MSPDTMNPMRAARRKAGKTIAQIAAALGVSERTVLRWELEQTKPDFQSVVRMARLLRRRAEDLVRVA